MTKTALEHANIKSRERIAADQRRHEKLENIKDRGVQVATAAIGALGRIGGSSIQAAAKRGASGGAATKVIGGGVRGWRDYNHPEWYKRIPELVKENTGIPTYYNNLQAVDGNGNANDISIPTLKTIYYVNSYGPVALNGILVGVNSLAINKAAESMYNAVNSYNSVASSGAEPSDLFEYFLAGEDLYERILYLGTTLQAYQYFDDRNPKLREAIITARGFSFTDFDANIKDYRKLYNIMVSEFNAHVRLPADMSLTKRREFLLTNIFKDGEDTNCQFVQYSPLYWFTYDEANGKLVPTLHSNTVYYYANWYQSWRASIDAMQYSAVTRELVRQLDNAARNGLALLTVNTEFNYKAPIAFNSLAVNLSQAMNTRLVPIYSHIINGGIAISACHPGRFITSAVISLMSSSGYGLRQDSSGALVPCMMSTGGAQLFGETGSTGIIISGSGIMTAGTYSGHTWTGADLNNIIFTDEVNINHYGDVDDDAVVEDSRNAVIWKAKTTADSTDAVHVVEMGSEVMILETIIKTRSDGLYNAYVTGGTVVTANGYYALNYLVPFNYFRVMKLVNFAGAGIAQSYGVDICQIGKYYKIPRKSLTSLHEMCFRSEIYIPFSSK